MAYQNVGSPRFIIDWLQWHKFMGYINGHNISFADTEEYGLESSAVNNMIGLYPSKPTAISNIDPAANNSIFINIASRENNAFNFCNIMGFVGHNLNDATDPFSCKFRVERLSNSNDATVIKSLHVPNDAFAIHALRGSGGYKFNVTDNGFSFIETTGFAHDDNRAAGYTNSGISIELGDITTAVINQNLTLGIGALLLGRKYDVPHSVDLDISMTREMDGVKSIKTPGGVTLSKRQYLRPKDWGMGIPAWDSSDKMRLARNGRRVWDLNFSYFNDSDIFPEISNLLNYSHGQRDWLDCIHEHSGANQPYSSHAENPVQYGLLDPALGSIRDSGSFYGEVIHPTNGGQLPFIFMPDKDNHQRDGFAICKFDKSFKFKQISNGAYNIKLKVREVW